MGRIRRLKSTKMKIRNSQGVSRDVSVLQQRVQQRHRVFAARKADDHAVAVFDHFELFDRVADFPHQNFRRVNRLPLFALFAI